MARAITSALLLVCGLFAGFPVLAEFRSIPAVQISDGLGDWVQRFTREQEALWQSGTYPAFGYSECAEVSELRQAYLCASDTRETMNLAFGRATAFTEGGFGIRGGSVLPHSDPRLQILRSTLGGNDLRGSDLLRFLDRSQAACRTSAALCLNPQESELFSSIVLPLSSEKPFAVISFSVDRNSSHRIVVSHELLHAQYFLDPRYSRAVDEFWSRSVPESDKKRIRKALSIFYNPKDEMLMRNEFQAYLLQFDAELDQLANYVPVYRASLLEELLAAGCPPIALR